MKFWRHTASWRRGTAATAALGVSVAVAVGGCGEIANTITARASTANQLTVELDGPPSAYDVGLYAAEALGYFKQTDIDVTFQTPTAGQDPLTMLHDDQVEVAISSEPSVFLTRNLNMPVVAVGALVQRPLSDITVTLPPGHLPTGGAAIGSGSATTSTSTAATTSTTTATGTAKSKVAKTRTAKTKRATTSSKTGTTSKTGTAPGATITSPATTTTPTPAQVPTGSAWPPKLQALLAQKQAPTYNALVIVVRKGTIVDNAPEIRRFVQAVARGYRAVRRDPRAAVADLIDADPGLATERRALLATVRSTLPYLFPPGGLWGWQSENDWNAFGTWMQKNGLITNPNAIGNASTNELLQGEGV